MRQLISLTKVLIFVSALVGQATVQAETYASLADLRRTYTDDAAHREWLKQYKAEGKSIDEWVILGNLEKDYDTTIRIKDLQSTKISKTLWAQRFYSKDSKYFQNTGGIVLIRYNIDCSERNWAIATVIVQSDGRQTTIEEIPSDKQKVESIAGNRVASSLLNAVCVRN